MEQPQYNLFERAKVEQEFAPLYDRIGLGLTTWSPLASGLLSGKYSEGVPSDSRAALPGYGWLKENVTSADANRRVGELAVIARELGASPAQLSIAWCASNPRVSTVITGASRVEQVRENLGALDVLDKLTPDLLARIDAIF
jgi:aryl-alcohol dehydrogenase-like predicted oxidoreductase